MNGKRQWAFVPAVLLLFALGSPADAELRAIHRAGQTFVIFVLTVAAAEAALAFGLVVLLFRRRRTLDAGAWSEMRG